MQHASRVLVRPTTIIIYNMVQTCVIYIRSHMEEKEKVVRSMLLVNIAIKKKTLLEYMENIIVSIYSKRHH